MKPKNATTLKVTWSNSEDCIHFTEYQFFVNGSLVSTFSQTSSHTLCDFREKDVPVPASSTYSCYMKAKDEDGGLWTSNTLQMPAIYVSTNADSSSALISWDAPTSGDLDDSWGDYYYIFKKYYFEEQFSEHPYDSVPNNINHYSDVADVCYRDIAYSVGITNTFHINAESTRNCNFQTVIGSVTLIDRAHPNAPVLDSVSFTEDNHVALGFHAPDERMYGFIAYFLGDNGWLSIDTIFNTTYWIDYNGDERCYRLAVLDSCINCSAMNEEDQCGIHLYLGDINNCQRNISVNWSNYPHLPGGVGAFELFLSRDHGATYQSIATTPNNVFSNTFDDLDVGTNYRAFVRVYNTDRSISASSNRIDFALETAASTDITHIRSVSVKDNDHVEILVHTSGDTLPFNHITLQRSENGTDFIPIQTLDHLTSSEYTFEDNSADFSKKTYYYQTFVNNSCNTESGFSNIEHNILLKGEATSAQENVLHWTNYGDMFSDVDHYLVYRKLESDLAFGEMPGSLLPATDNNYHDDVSALFENGSKFKYFIATVPSTDEYGFSDISNSNEIVLQQLPNTYIPNAFTPKMAINNVFLPKNTFVSTEDYTFAIYSRFGELIFITHDPNAGWDGYVGGKLAPNGVYIYKLTYLYPDKSVYEKTGTVTLLK